MTSKKSVVGDFLSNRLHEKDPKKVPWHFKKPTVTHGLIDESND